MAELSASPAATPAKLAQPAQALAALPATPREEEVLQAGRVSALTDSSMTARMQPASNATTPASHALIQLSAPLATPPSLEPTTQSPGCATASATTTNKIMSALPAWPPASPATTPTPAPPAMPR